MCAYTKMLPPHACSGKSRSLYCYDCLVPLTPHVPHVDLPFKVTIITHQNERPANNTGVQVALLAAGHVDMHE